MTGYTEVLTWILCSKKEIFSMLNREEDNSAVTIADSRTSEFEVTLLCPPKNKLSIYSIAPLPEIHYCMV